MLKGLFIYEVSLGILSRGTLRRFTTLKSSISFPQFIETVEGANIPLASLIVLSATIFPTSHIEVRYPPKIPDPIERFWFPNTGIFPSLLRNGWYDPFML
ncbi:hypothetical protein SDC9_209133 [bioreactor metagenome]|uniref:Uncharacterized protein n=1 Tax=bioreactor metagenome TaxID=1076179 RepID=A0A645JD68_9ZZZZ